MGDGIPTSKKEKGIFLLTFSFTTNSDVPWGPHGKALECSSFVALDKSLCLPEHQFPLLCDSKGIPDDLPCQHPVLKSQGVYLPTFH